MTLAFDALDISDSPLARLDPRWKLAALSLAILITGFLQTLPAIFSALAIAVLMLAVARLPVRFLLWRYGAFVLFLMLFLVLLPITEGRQGLFAALRVGSRALAIYSFGLVLLGTAPFATTIHAGQALGIPRPLTQITLMSYRYIFVLADEFSRIRLALRLRGFRNKMNRHSYRTVGNVTGALLVRGADRAERIGQAMRCRGFDGHFRTLYRFRTRRADVLLFAALMAAMGGIFAWDWYLRT
ncbi:MAG TPA: cobalt ECF transporter T component CbiQ [Gemmataceae bacterium]|nr:cobalt ECF transporter T component CbiQ [Gemmataceae bacterium]